MAIPLRLLFVLLCLPWLAPVLAWAQADQIVYDDALQNSWQSFGWATLNFANSSPVHGGSKSISVVDPTTNYQALYLHHAAQDSSNLQSLRFWIYVTSSTTNPAVVQATRNGNPQTGVPLSNLTPNAWTQVTLSISSLGITNVADFDGFWIQNNTGGPATFYVDDITLVAVLAPNPVQVTVDASSMLRTLDGRIYGLNTAIWDAQLGTASSANLLSAMGTQVLRFPGGSASDDYDWQTNRSISSGSFQWASSAATLATTAAGHGAQACITVNYGNGTPEQAAAWVAWCNASSSNSTSLGVDAKGRDWKTAGFWASLRGAAPLGTDDGFNFLRLSHPTPFAFHDWEVGNENYGDWENDLHGTAGSGLTGSPHDPYTYAQYFVNFRAKMLAVDATIHIGAVAPAGEDSYGNGTHAVPNPNEGNSLHSGWTPVMLATLKSLGVAPHFIIYHSYAQEPGNESDSFLLQSTSSAAANAANLRKMITDYYPGSGGADIELQMTELNSVSYNPGKQSVSLVNGLFMADMLGQLSRTEFNACMWWDFRNGADSSQNNNASLYGWRNFGDYGLVASGDRGDTPVNTPYPPFYAAKLLTHWGRGGDQIVWASTNYSLLTAHAALLANGNLALLIVNKSPNTDFNTQITLSHFLPGATTATTFSYGKTNDLASSDLSTSSMSNASSTLAATFPSYSMTVIVLSKPQSFASWQTQKFTPTELSNPSISGANADPDHDGLSNLMEYALSFEPKTANPAGSPALGKMQVSGKNYLTLTFPKPRVIGDVQYIVQVSDDLHTWHSGGGYVVRVDDGSTDTAVYRDVSAIGDTPAHFMRLQVSQ